MAESIVTRGQEKAFCKSVETFRSVFLSFFVPLFGAIAYWFVNFDSLSVGQMCVVGAAIFFCACVVAYDIFMYNYYLRKIKELK